MMQFAIAASPPPSEPPIPPEPVLYPSRYSLRQNLRFRRRGRRSPRQHRSLRCWRRHPGDRRGMTFGNVGFLLYEEWQSAASRSTSGR
jgi:hypothetical protein